MTVNPNDIYYRREIVPPALHAIGPPLCAVYGVSAINFGDRGNLSHTYGYHRSRDFILRSPDSTRGKSDYSIQLGADKGGDDRWVSAFDFTPGAWGTADNRAKMRTLTQRLLDAARARDPRVAELREFAGTLDGKNVVTYDLTTMSFKAPFDSTHLDHLHGSIFRGMAASDHGGIVSVLLGASMADSELVQALAWRMDAIAYGLDEVRGGPTKGEKMWLVTAVKAVLAKSDLSPEELAAVEAAAKEGAAGGKELQLDEVRKVVDEELDEAFKGAADSDS